VAAFIIRSYSWGMSVALFGMKLEELFNVNFNILFKAVLLWSSWHKISDNIKIQVMTVKKKITLIG
jgi:hypothetical protein